MPREPMTDRVRVAAEEMKLEEKEGETSELVCVVGASDANY